MMLTRDCSCCRRRLPLESYGKRVSAGGQGTHRHHQCRQCRARYLREWRKDPKPAKPARHTARRTTPESLCDAALAGWGVAGGAAFQGARL
jgi:hypothetical protein